MKTYIIIGIIVTIASIAVDAWGAYLSGNVRRLFKSTIWKSNWAIATSCVIRIPAWPVVAFLTIASVLTNIKKQRNK